MGWEYASSTGPGAVNKWAAINEINTIDAQGEALEPSVVAGRMTLTQAKYEALRLDKRRAKLEWRIDKMDELDRHLCLAYLGFIIVLPFICYFCIACESYPGREWQRGRNTGKSPPAWFQRIQDGVVRQQRHRDHPQDPVPAEKSPPRRESSARGYERQESSTWTDEENGLAAELEVTNGVHCSLLVSVIMETFMVDNGWRVEGSVATKGDAEVRLLDGEAMICVCTRDASIEVMTSAVIALAGQPDVMLMIDAAFVNVSELSKSLLQAAPVVPCWATVVGPATSKPTCQNVVLTCYGNADKPFVDSLEPGSFTKFSAGSAANYMISAHVTRGAGEGIYDCSFRVGRFNKAGILVATNIHKCPGISLDSWRHRWSDPLECGMSLKVLQEHNRFQLR